MLIAIWHRIRAWFAGRRLLAALRDEAAETILEFLLASMRLAFLVDRGFRRHIEGFEGRYLFACRGGGVAVRVVFRDGEMHFDEKPIQDQHVKVLFKDDAALMSFLLTRNPDLIGSLLRQELTFEGNLNYLYKFAYLAKRLERRLLGET